MHPSKRTALGAAAIAAIAFAVPALASPHRPGPNPGSGNHYPSASASFTCYADPQTGLVKVGEVDFAGPKTLWPPNHKFIDESSTAIDSNGQMVTLTLMVNPTEGVGGDGGPQHDPDTMYPGPTGPTASGQGSAAVPYQLRAERSGKEGDRVYQVDWTALFSNNTVACSSQDGNNGHAPFFVTVPHDMGNNG